MYGLGLGLGLRSGLGFRTTKAGEVGFFESGGFRVEFGIKG